MTPNKMGPLTKVWKVLKPERNSLMFAVSAIVLAIVAAVRGMWSPCGLSMLSTMTPMAERLRGHRFGVTASWFAIGAMLGGATLGLLSGLGAALIHLAHLSSSVTATLAICVAMVCLLSDCELGAVQLPPIRRQVNERWVERYRPSVYAGGFGWQLGAGLTTYVMTASNYLLVALGALSGSPRFAMGICILFGTIRGAVIFVNAKVTTTERLFAMHRFLEANAERSKVVCLGAEALVITAGATVLFGAVGVIAGVAAFALALLLRRRRSSSPAPQDLVSS